MTSAQAPASPAADGFSALGLDAGLLAGLSELGYEEPTPIQREAIPALLDGRDLLGQAATGTGKTAAFALPILQRIGSVDGARAAAPSALILVPTRELAMQVAEAVHRYGKTYGARVLPIYGGQAMQQQLRALRRGVEVIVATPGRVLDHIRRGSIDLDSVGMVVLDEADEMLDMGFVDDLEAILEVLPAERQTALFSATMAPRIAAIARKHLRDPVRLSIARERAAAGEEPLVREVAYVVSRQQKIEALGRILDMESPNSAIVFCRTRMEVDQLAEVLAAHGHGAQALHGGMTQEQRDRVMRRFREGTVELLVATDVAARGLDIGHLSHVVNYDIPSSTDAYVHRIGRTGRAGREGVAITLLEPREKRLLRSIEQAGKRRISLENVPTVLDIRARRMELTSTAVREILEDGDLDSYGVIVEALSTDYDLTEIAAAALKLAHEAQAPVAEGADITPPPEPNRGVAKRTGKRASTDGKPKARQRRGREDFVKIYIPLGHNAGVRAADLVGAIVNEAAIDPAQIGAIDIADSFSLVEVWEDEADAIVDALRKTKIRGRTANVRRERPPGHKGASRAKR
jgi:ATP-dependent RNA helicase DeaD